MQCVGGVDLATSEETRVGRVAHHPIINHGLVVIVFVDLMSILD